jgi:GH24 family phage-related lysozyme (muramidase)
MRHAVRSLGLLVCCSLTAAAPGAEPDREKLRAQLVRHELKMCKAYLDIRNRPLIGVGFNLDREDAKQKIEALGLDYARVRSGGQALKEEQVLKLLEADIDQAIADCKAVFPGFSDLSDVRQRVLIDMMFSLGKAPLKASAGLIAAVKDGDFAKAADQMKGSAWYRQGGMRARTLEAMMRDNKDPAEQSVVGVWESDWGPVALIGTDEAFTGFWIQGTDKRGIITKGFFDPGSRTLKFAYYQDWNKQLGEAELTLSKDGKILSGSYKQTSNSGRWTMTRKTGCD